MPESFDSSPLGAPGGPELQYVALPASQTHSSVDSTPSFVWDWYGLNSTLGPLQAKHVDPIPAVRNRDSAGLDFLGIEQDQQSPEKDAAAPVSATT